MPPPKCEKIAYKYRKREQRAEQAHWTQRLPGSEQLPESPSSDPSDVHAGPAAR